jgi:hypothetical protein
LQWRRKINSIDLAVASAQVPLDFCLPSEIRKKRSSSNHLRKETQGYPFLPCKRLQTPASKYPKQSIAQHATHESNYEIKSSCAKSSDEASLQHSSCGGVSLSLSVQVLSELEWVVFLCVCARVCDKEPE